MIDKDKKVDDSLPGRPRKSSYTYEEIIEAGNQNLNMWGFTCFTNMAAGMEKGVLTHSEVLSNAEKFKEKFKEFISQLMITYKRGN